MPSRVEEYCRGGTSMAVSRFQDDDHGFATWVTENPRGYIVNIQRSLHASDARMHTASCGHIAQAISASESGQRRSTATYIKVCSRSVDQLDEWSAQRVGAQIRRCPSCWDASQKTREPTVRPEGATAAPAPDLPAGRYRIRVLPDEIILDAPRYLPFERLDNEQLNAREELRTALAGLTAGPGEILHAWYSGPRPPNSDVENLVLYNVDSGGASFNRASTFGTRFELDSRSPDPGEHCLYRYRVVPTKEPLTAGSSGHVWPDSAAQNSAPSRRYTGSPRPGWRFTMRPQKPTDSRLRSKRSSACFLDSKRRHRHGPA